MTVTEIPRSFIYTCDVCGDGHKQENATSHYWNSTPPGWATLTLISNDDPTDTPLKLKEHALMCELCAGSIARVLGLHNVIETRKEPTNG